MSTTRKFNRNKINLFLDTALAVAFAIELQMRFTGLRIHELLGLAFSAAFVIHISLHLDWVISITRRFFQKLFHESRLNYVLNLALLADLATTAVTGILISRTLSLNLGIGFQAQQTAHQIHILASNLSLVLIGLHVGLHWKWIATHVQKVLLGWLPRVGRKPQAATPSITGSNAG